MLPIGVLAAETMTTSFILTEIRRLVKFAQVGLLGAGMVPLDD
jgi:hypothetical protein